MAPILTSPFIPLQKGKSKRLRTANEASNNESVIEIRKRLFASCCAVLLAALMLGGCTRIREAERFTYRAPTSIDTRKLKLGGYYYVRGTPSDQAIRPLILWEDGTAAIFYKFSDIGQFEKVARDLPDGRGRFFEWGAFRIDGDSIETQMVSQVAPGGQLGVYGVSEYSGVVLNDTTFTIEKANFAGINKGERDIKQLDWTYHFRPLEKTTLAAKPDSSNWLKERFQ